MKRTGIPLLAGGVVTVLVSAGCSFEPSPKDVVIDRVKESNANAEWFDHVTDWDDALGSNFTAKTDYPTNNPKLYAEAVSICKAFASEIDPEASESYIVRVYGIKTTEKKEMDGSKSSSKDDEMMAQMSTALSRKECGATILDFSIEEEEVEALGIPLY